MILDSHSRIACGPELKVTPMILRQWQTLRSVQAAALDAWRIAPADVDRLYRDLLLGLLDPYRRASGKARIAEKSPNNVFFFPALNTLFPESPLVHVVRDGRDVVASLLTMNWIDAATGAPLAYTRDAAEAARYWVKAVRAGRQAASVPAVGARYVEVAYERLVAEPESTLKALFAALGEPWEAPVLDYYRQARDLASESSAAQVSRPLYASAVGRWRSDLSPQQAETVIGIAGPLLAELGYADEASDSGR